MAKIKTGTDIAILREIGKKHARIFEEIKRVIVPGISTKELDELADKLIREGDEDDIPAFLNYQPYGANRPYPASMCVSINEEIVHGIPKENKILKEGDIVSCDLGIKRDGLITDAAFSVGVGNVNKEIQKLMDVTEKALYAGIEKCVAGNKIGDISRAIWAIAKPYKYGIPRDLGGHGVGHKVHEDPFIPNFGKAGTGPIIENGMVLALEPMFTLGSSWVIFLDDGYTAVTEDSSISAHFEHTVAVTENGPLIITAP